MAAVTEDKSEQESEAEEDVYEVERIVDMKVSEGQILYRVHWKGYSSDEDTWEPEAHLEDCTEVLQVFKRKSVEKTAIKDNRKFLLDKDIFEDDFGEDDGGTREFSPLKIKKKKKIRAELDMNVDSSKKEQKMKSKSRSNSETELKDTSSGNVKELPEEDMGKKKCLADLKRLKKKTERLSSSSESLTHNDLMVEANLEEDKEQEVDSNEPIFGERSEKAVKKLARPDSVTAPKRSLDSSEEDDLEHRVKRKKKLRVDDAKLEIMAQKKNQKDDHTEKKSISKENSSQGKKHKSHEKRKESVSSIKSDGLDIKVPRSPKSSKVEDKGRKSLDGENSTIPKSDLGKNVVIKKLMKMHNVTTDGSLKSGSASTEQVFQGSEFSVTTSGQTSLFTESSSLFDKLSLVSEPNKGENVKLADRPNYSATNTDGKLEVIKISAQSCSREKVGKKGEASKDLFDKMLDTDKGEKGRKEQNAERNNREMKGLFDKFMIPLNEVPDKEDRENREDGVCQEPKSEDTRTKEKQQLQKDKKSLKEENDARLHSAVTVEETQEVLDTICQTEENADSRPEVLKLGVDLQLDWMTLEEFQKHLDGNDDLISSAKNITNSVLRDAVKNGDYLTVKRALNSNEEYNLDQEDPSGMNLVMFAAAGGQDDILRLLIKKDAKINSRQKNGTTALMHAAEKNYLTTVAILLEAGSQVNVQQISGETALMKACKRGNADIVRLLLEYGADCGILSKHQNSALYYAKQSNNLLVYDLLKNHVETISRVAEETIRDYFEARLTLLEPVFPIACHRLCEGPDFAMDFNFKPQHNSIEGTGILLFIFHANFFSHDHIVAKLCGPCSVQAVVLNDKFQLPVFLDSHFIYSFSPVPGPNKLFIRLAEAPTAKVKLLICAYRVQLQ
ncbi:M-phase phosphoprotein 8 [Callorhinchus milii]|uniref:Poly(ADP-ribose) polymerase family member 4 n=1 Tax=Callorhinchus milii TaxID=7868 RepID=A0A4W3HJR8_CALMI|nr:M-phase phosphoprotein 8 [Callorhinchus milii]|eukprot:gi/632974621/ref/XP_007903781.1/ PREDICTED: M-phase phosphoprotein 8 [Callorhinchus milii]